MNHKTRKLSELSCSLITIVRGVFDLKRSERGWLPPFPLPSFWGFQSSSVEACDSQAPAMMPCLLFLSLVSKFVVAAPQQAGMQARFAIPHRMRNHPHPASPSSFVCLSLLTAANMRKVDVAGRSMCACCSLPRSRSTGSGGRSNITLGP